MGYLIKITSLLTLPLYLAACGGSDIVDTITPDSGNGSNGGALALKAAASDAELEAQIKTSLLNSYGSTNNDYYTGYVTETITSGGTTGSTSGGTTGGTTTGGDTTGGFSTGGGNPTAATSSDAGTGGSTGGSAATSTTNTQESSVDEADRLKTDGNYLYVSSIDQPSVSIFKAEIGAAPLVKTYSLATQNNALLSGFYLRDSEDQLLAISGDGAQSYPVWDMWFSPYYWQNRQTELFSLDVSDPNNPIQQSKVTVDGQLISSRRIGSYLYLATRHTPTPKGIVANPQSQTDAVLNRSLINSSSLDDLLPTYRINDGEAISLFDSGDCFVTGYNNVNNQQSSIISVVAINLDAASPEPEAKCYVGDAETLYVSEKALYLATTGYQYETTNGTSVYSGAPTTEVHKFALDGTEVAYKGSTSVAGHLGWQQDLKPFRMSEYNDVLRIITYTGSQESSVSSPARLYTIGEDTSEDTLKVMGKLPNSDRPAPLGKPGEQVYASRFIGEKGYLVTFRMTDPLYVLDLSDPEDPFIASELQIDGYSDYLHPVGENYLLGIGKDAIADTSVGNVNGDGRGAWYQGVKLSLIDISNPSAPFEKEKIIIGGRGTETAVSQSHHALTTLQEGSTLKMALPISLHYTSRGSTYYDINDPRYRYEWTHDELYRLNINKLTGDISVQPSIISESNDAGINYYTRYELDRSVMIGDEVYYLHKDEIRTTADITP